MLLNAFYVLYLYKIKFIYSGNYGYGVLWFIKINAYLHILDIAMYCIIIVMITICVWGNQFLFGISERLNYNRAKFPWERPFNKQNTCCLSRPDSRWTPSICAQSCAQTAAASHAVCSSFLLVILEIELALHLGKKTPVTNGLYLGLQVGRGIGAAVSNQSYP